MYRVVLDSSEVARRYKGCQHLLSPLVEVPSTGGPAIQRVVREHAIAYGAHGGSPPGDIREWRFRTFHPDFTASYIETWSPVSDRLPGYFLRSVALAIYKKSNVPGDEREFLALHCEPNEPPGLSPTSNIYKRSPHLHIEVAAQPLPKSHLSLAHPFLKQILQSESNLFRVLRLAVEMLRDEVLSRA